MRNVIGLLVFVCLAAIPARADAQQQITFDELSPSQTPILGSVVCADSVGFRFFSEHFHLIGGTFASDFSSNGTSHIGYESGRGAPITLERIGGGTFSLLSFDLGEFYATPNSDRPDAQTLLITGHVLGGSTVTHTVSLDGIHDGAGGAADFEHVVLPATFVNLTSVVFTGQRFDNPSGGIALDNIEYQLATPETLAACVPVELPSDAPTVTITNPSAGNVVGTINVEAGASDNLGVVSVQFKLDGVDLGVADTTAPYAVIWDTTLVPDGPHTLTAEARDADGNLSTATVIVTVRNHTSGGTDPHYLDFDGADDFAEVADSGLLSFGNGVVDSAFTFEMWLRPDAMTRHLLLGKWGNGSNREYQLHIASGVMRLDLLDASSGATVSAFTSNLSALVGGWHHVAVTYDGRGGATAANGITFYVDGVGVPLTRFSNASYLAMENTTATLLIGREGPNWRQYNGGLDELRIWNVLRTSAEIQSYMTTELTGAEAGLVAYWRLNDGTGITADDASASDQTAILLNGTTWLAGGPMAPVLPDVTAPELSGLVTSNLTESSITISFATDEPATGWVSYSSTGSCPCVDVFSSSTGTAHTITLTGLAAETTYQFTVKATDAANNTGVGPTLSFSTPVAPPDVTAPSVTIVRPAMANVSGAVLLEASASDARGVVSVQFKVDGVNLGSPIAVAPFVLSWDSDTVTDGAHTITAEAIDAANNVGTASVVVNVGPVVTVPHYLEFDGADDYLEVADADGLTFGTGTTDTAMTLEMWLRPDAMGRNQLLNKGSNGTNQEYKLHIASGFIRLDLIDASTQASVSAFTMASHLSMIGTWHHLAVVYDGRGGANAANGITILIDGVSVPLHRMNNPAYVSMENTSAPLLIGREGPNWKQYDGGLDEIRLWSVERTLAEIQATMAVGLNGSEPGLVAYWRFDDGPPAATATDARAGYVAVLNNGTTWVPGGPMAPIEPDITAPEISAIVGTNLTDSSITITFTTNEPATGWVSYTATGACPCTDVYSSDSGTMHVVTLTGLAPVTTYQFVVHATDSSSNAAMSAAMTFSTPVAPPDLTAPVVTIVRPVTTNVTGVVLLEAAASDARGVVSVQFKMDGVNVGQPLTGAPYILSWDSSTVVDGSHTLTVEARDAANNIGTASLTINVGPIVTTPHYVEFDGIDDYLQAADADGLSFGNGTADTPLTIEMWIRPDVMTRNQLLGKWAEGTSQEYKVHIASGVIRLDMLDASSRATVSVFTSGAYTSLIGTWHHLAITYDGRGGATAADGVTIYIDGIAVPVVRFNNAGYVAMENTSAPLMVGREGPNWKQFDGAMDELRFWNVARSPSEILAAMSAELGGGEAGLVAYWRFDDGAPSPTATDLRAGYMANLISGTLWVGGGPFVP